MARTPNQEQPLQVDIQIDPSLEQGQKIMSAVLEEYSDDRDLINQLIGEVKTWGAIKHLSSTVEVSKLEYIKQNKLYQSLRGVRDLDGRGLTGTWEEFCKLIGSSAGKINEDILNLNAIGEKALEVMQQVGIGYRELRQFRKLPEDEKTALIEVAEAGDKVALLDLAEELIAKQTKEKEALNKQLEDTKLDLESSRKLLNTKDSKINELSTQLEKKALIEPPSVDEQIKQLRHEINMIAFEAESIIRGKLRVGFEKLNSEYGSTEREVMAGWVGNIRSALNQLAGEFDLPEIDDEFAWAKED